MVKKKKENLKIKSPAVFILTMVILCVVVILFLYFVETSNKFNPETDVCLEWELCNNEEGFCNIVESEEICDECIEKLKWIDFSKECVDFRTKNKCELNTESEGCICDEWQEICDMEYILTNESFIYEGRFNCKNSGNCIKAHLPNECELNNPKYIDAPEWIDWHDGTFTEGCPQTKSCRLKQIYDFSCEELFEAILKDQYYDSKTSSFQLLKGATHCGKSTKTIICTYDIVDVYKKKGCFY